MECNRPDQVSFTPGKLWAHTPILCPHLGCTYLKQTLQSDKIRQNIFVLWPAPEAFFSRFLAHFVEQDRQPQMSVSPVASPHRLATAHLVNQTGMSHSINLAKWTLIITFDHVHLRFRTTWNHRSCLSQLTDGCPQVCQPWQGAMGCHWH